MFSFKQSKLRPTSKIFTSLLVIKNSRGCVETVQMTRHQRSTLFSSRQTVLRNTPCWSFTLKSTSPGGPTHSHAGSHRPGVSRQKLSWVTLVLLGGGYQPWPCRAALEPAALPLCALPPYPPPGRHRSLMDGWCRSRPNPADTHSVVTHTETSRYVFTL